MALPASGPISFSQIRSELVAYGQMNANDPVSLNNVDVRDLLSGPTATSGAPYANNTQISMLQSYSKAWRITITRINSAASTATYDMRADALLAAGAGESGTWVKTYRPIDFTLTNSSTMRSPSTGASYALRTNSSGTTFPTNTILKLINNSGAYVAGKGGNGGTGGTGAATPTAPTVGLVGGRAIEARYNLTVTNSGVIGGGGGGGGGGGSDTYSTSRNDYYADGGNGGGGCAGGSGGVGGTVIATFTGSNIGESGGSAGNGLAVGGDGGNGGTIGLSGGVGVSGSQNSGAAGGANGAAIGKLSTVTVSITGNSAIGGTTTIT